MNVFLHEIRYALRTLRRSPGFTAVAALTLALGIGATTTIFSAIDALLLDPLPFRDGDRLVAIRQFSDRCPLCTAMAPGNMLSLRETSTALSDVAAMTGWDYAMRGTERTEIVQGYRVTRNFFRMLGVPAALGRTFIAEDAEPDAERVVILSDAFWRSRFGGDPGVIGETVVLDGQAHTVVGVLPADYTFPPGGEVWVPLSFGAEDANNRTSLYLDVFGRLRPGAGLDDARVEVAALGERIAAEFPESMAGWRWTADPMRAWHMEPPTRWMLGVMMGAVAFVLLIACINLAGLFIARSTTRRRELAIRAALGASRSRIAGRLLAESVVLGLVGGAAGILIAVWAVPMLHEAVPADLAGFVPGWPRMGVDARVVGFTLAVSIGTGILFGLAPALRFSRPGVAGALREGARGTAGERSANRLRRTLVVGEIALALVLLAGAGLLVRSVANRIHADPGFRSDHVLTLELRWPVGMRGQAGEAYGRLVDRIEALPGVRTAGVVSNLPLSHSSRSSSFSVEGQPPATPADRPSARMQRITPHYFSAMRIPLVAGRAFDDRDRADAPRVAIINQTLARRYFPGEDPLGRGLVIGDRRWEVVGVVGDVFHQGVGDAVDPEIYLPQAQAPQVAAALAVATEGDPARAAPAIRRAIRDFDADLAIARVRTMDGWAAWFLAPYRLVMGIMAAFALIALVISGVGLYGVISYAVAQRTREFGVRTALGARPRDVLRLVVGQGARLAGIGLALGLAGALAVTPLLGFLLYGVDATDPATLVVVGGLLAGVALLASYVPARRATSIDPMEALRAE
ncbi:MAG TPA: ABC transporter permease [Longimicrobiales bacterium]